jgi:peptide/nickel transport system permease protein
MTGPGAVSAWLFDDEPRSRTQARLGSAARSAALLVRDPLGTTGLAIVAALIVVAVAAPFLPLHDPNQQTLALRLQAPSSVNWFGTDMLGRDIFSRVLHGARPTLTIVVSALAIVVPFGLFVGCLAGMMSALDKPLMRFCDIFMAFPRLILAIAVAATLGAGLSTAIVAIVITGWPLYARLARAEAVVYRHAEFVEASRCLGVPPWRILVKHIMPLCVPLAMARATLDAASIVLITSGLGFLGASVPPPQPEWGAMIADGRDVLFDAWWVSTIPGIAILLVSLGFNLLGDGLRNVLDPRAN